MAPDLSGASLPVPVPFPSLLSFEFGEVLDHADCLHFKLPIAVDSKIGTVNPGEIPRDARPGTPKTVESRGRVGSTGPQG